MTGTGVVTSSPIVVLAGLLALAASLLAYLSSRPWSVQPYVSPDGRWYLTMGLRRPAPLPFALRWLLPRVCGSSLGTWRWCTTMHLIVLLPITTLWLHHWIPSVATCVVGAVLIVGLPGIWRIHLRAPVLADATAMTWGLMAALLAVEGLTLAALVAAFVAGATKEISPAFAAVFATSPLLLVGLAAPAIRLMLIRGQSRSPAAAPGGGSASAVVSRTKRMREWDPGLLLAPWGICLLSPFAHDADLLRMLVLALVLAYGQLLVATDTVRLYQWAAPVAILCTISTLPTWLIVIALPAHIRNPWAGTGY